MKVSAASIPLYHRTVSARGRQSLRDQPRGGTPIEGERGAAVGVSEHPYPRLEGRRRIRAAHSQTASVLGTWHRHELAGAARSARQGVNSGRSGASSRMLALSTTVRRSLRSTIEDGCPRRRCLQSALLSCWVLATSGSSGTASTQRFGSRATRATSRARDSEYPVSRCVRQVPFWGLRLRCSSMSAQRIAISPTSVP